jgi:hypothetical protein
MQYRAHQHFVIAAKAATRLRSSALWIAAFAATTVVFSVLPVKGQSNAFNGQFSTPC